jgi:hypothetical protein
MGLVQLLRRWWHRSMRVARHPGHPTNYARFGQLQTVKQWRLDGDVSMAAFASQIDHTFTVCTLHI